MKLEQNFSLATLTSFNVGGEAENLYFVQTDSELDEVIKLAGGSVDWLLGFGTNVLISDKGLPGTTLVFRTKNISWQGNEVIADAGVWWDDLVAQSIERGLWGLELMSGIPGSVGGGAFINITAYGQALADSLLFVEVFDQFRKETIKLSKDDLALSYKTSLFTKEPGKSRYIIRRVALKLSPILTTKLDYQSAIDIALKNEWDPNLLTDRRKIIMAAREQAGSLFDYQENNLSKTVGSFFKNPLISHDLAQQIISFDETGKTGKQIEKMNQVHGGNSMRVSAAHVMLAAGFKRGQVWGKVKLHDKNLLKIENAGGATAKEIYDTAMHIIETVQSKFGVNLEPEAKILGDFS
jgi:UDP-N-acetylmuramate dehydrogenase